MTTCAEPLLFNITAMGTLPFARAGAGGSLSPVAGVHLYKRGGAI